MKLLCEGWSEKARGGLERLIEAGSGKGLPAVFDFDNTIVCGDIGEATMALLARDGIVRGESIPELISPPFLSKKGTPISLRDCADPTVYYEALLEATQHHGNEYAPLSNGYTWAVQIMGGLSAREVTEATEKVYGMSESFTEKSLVVTPGISAYPVPFFYPQMVELIAALIAHRYEVWIVSASNVWTIRWMVLRALNPELRAHGIDTGIAPERVVGVSTLLTDSGRMLYKDQLLVRNQQRYAAMEEEFLSGLTLTGMLNLPVPVYSGKVANILDLVGARPWLCAGDSPGDIPMLSFSGHRLWIARLEKTGYQRELASAAARTTDGSWLVQPALSKNAEGFVGNAEGAGDPQPVEAQKTIAASLEAVRALL